jgi:hypothetical protein
MPESALEIFAPRWMPQESLPGDPEAFEARL